MAHLCIDNLYTSDDITLQRGGKLQMTSHYYCLEYQSKDGPWEEGVSRPRTRDFGEILASLRKEEANGKRVRLLSVTTTVEKEAIYTSRPVQPEAMEGQEAG